MIVATDYGSGGAGALLDYMTRDDEREAELRDQTGRRVSEQERDRFVERSREHDYHRQHVLSPHPDADLDQRDLDRGVRKTMSAFRSRVSGPISYLYSIHRNGGARPHAHVAITGPKRVLTMDRADLREHREQARAAFRETQRLATRTLDRERDREQERVAVATRQLGPTRDRDGGA